MKFNEMICGNGGEMYRLFDKGIRKDLLVRVHREVFLYAVFFLFSFGEAEGGEDDADGGECHGCAADEWGEVSAGGEGDADDVVDECPEEVLADGGHGEAGEGECACDGGEV